MAFVSCDYGPPRKKKIKSSTPLEPLSFTRWTSITPIMLRPHLPKQSVLPSQYLIWGIFCLL